MLITFVYQNYLEEANGKCKSKGRFLAWAFIVSSMGNKMKRIFKGFKYIFNNFAVKERELEIGCPTDIKHVAHIGWDGPSDGNAPSWMNQFKKGPDFAAASIGNSGSSFLHGHLKFESQTERQSTSEIYKNNPTNKEVHVHTKKQKRTKHKATSSPNSSSSSSKKSSRAVKSKAKFVKGTAIPASIEVA